MIIPLSSRPLHTIRYHATSLRNVITLLFYKIMACFNQEYGEYYGSIVESRFIANKIAEDRLIQNSVNSVHPRKIKEIPPFCINNKDLGLIDKGFPRGFCVGMSLDYMRRFKSSNRPFSETVTLLAKKFEQGATKKAFIVQTIFCRIKATKAYIDRLGHEKINCLDPFREMVCSIREEMIKSLDLGLKPSYLNHEFTKEKHALIPNGDYLLFYGSKYNPGHVICLFKREQDTVVFDPNIGTCYFKNSEELYEFIEKSANTLFSGDIKYDLYRCA